MEWLKDRLVDDCRQALRWWSVRVHLAAIAFLTLYELVPAVPAEVQALIPGRYRVLIVGLYAVAGIAARLVKQRAPDAA